MAPMLIFRFWLPTITVQSNCIVTILFSSDAAQRNYNCYDSISVFLTINENLQCDYIVKILFSSDVFLFL